MPAQSASSVGAALFAWRLAAVAEGAAPLRVKNVGTSLPGDAACWGGTGVLSYWDPNWPKGRAIEQALEQPSLIHNLCCSDGAAASGCWRGGFDHARCCTAEYQALASPGAGRCPEGYEPRDGIPAQLACDDLSDVPGWCILGREAAFQFCDESPDCCGVSETSNLPWRIKHLEAFFVGACPMKTHHEWKTCSKKGGPRGAHQPLPSLRARAPCWNSLEVQSACCGVRPQVPICGLGGETTYQRCCGDASEGRTSGGQPARKALKLFSSRCWSRLWHQEALATFVGKARDVPELRPIDLGSLVLHFYDTGDALPTLLLIVEGIKRLAGGGFALDVCAAAAVLAQLVDLERSLYQNPPALTRARLRDLEQFWGVLMGRAMPSGQAAPNMTRQVPRSPPSDWKALASLLVVSDAQGEELPGGSDMGVLILRAISRGFARLRGSVEDLARLARARGRKDRRLGSFSAHLILPVCWPADAQQVRTLQKLVLSVHQLDTIFTLYVYDICYGLLEPGSPDYDLRNALEFDMLTGRSARSDEGRSLRARGGALPEDLLALARRFRRAFLVPFHEEVPVGEVAVMLRHVAHHYEQLPDALVFFHPDAYEHIPPDLLTAVFRSLSLRLWPKSTPFLYLGHRHNPPVDSKGRVGSELHLRCHVRWGSGRTLSVFRGGSQLTRKNKSLEYTLPNTCLWTEHTWEMIFGEPLRVNADDYGGYDFAQVVVLREAALSRPRDFWVRAWQALTRRQNYELLPGTRFVSWRADGYPALAWHKGVEIAAEHMTHVLFSPRAKSWLSPTRLRDPAVPLTFKSDVILGPNPDVLQYYHWTPHLPL